MRLPPQRCEGGRREEGDVEGSAVGAVFDEVAGVAGGVVREFVVVVAPAGEGVGEAGGFEGAVQRRRQPEGEQDEGDEGADARHAGNEGGGRGGVKGQGVGARR